MIVVHITDKILSVMEGAPGMPAAAQSVVTLEGMRGCVRDGVIVDPTGFQNIVGSFWKENQLPLGPVKVVLDSPHFLARSIEAPVFKKEAELNAYLQRELASVSRIKTPLFTYHAEGAGKKPNTQKLTVIAVESVLVERLVSAFESFGVKVTAIVSAHAALIHALVDNLTQLGDSTAVLGLLLGEDAVQSVMMGEGHYSYSTKQNVFNERGTEGYANEVARMVSGIKQYTMAEDHQQFEEIVLFTATQEIARLCAAAIAGLGIDAKTEIITFDQLFSFPAGTSAAEAKRLLPAVCALTAPADGAALIDALLGEKSDGAATKLEIFERLRPYAAPIAALAVCLVLTGILGAWNGVTQAKVSSLNAQLETQQVKEALEARTAAQSEADAASARLESAQSLVAGLTQYPQLSGSVNKHIARCANGLVSFRGDSYDAQKGVYVIVASSKSEKTINKFVRRLIDDGYFQVNYSGYAYGNDADRWELSIELTLPAGKGE